MSAMTESQLRKSFDDAGRRIEELEAALHEIKKVPWTFGAGQEIHRIANAALADQRESR